MACCGAGPESQPDEGALLSQLCSVLKDYEGLEEIDKMLGIPTLAGQVRPCRHLKKGCRLIRLDMFESKDVRGSTPISMARVPPGSSV